MYRNKTFRVCALVVVGVVASEGAAQAACGTASWYHEGAKTANGERYRPDGISAAHKTLPFGTRVLVRNQRTGRTVTVRINDRGPFIRGRIIDLSRGAKRVLGMDGLAPVCLTVLGRGERYADAGDSGERRVSRKSRGNAVGHGERYADAGDTNVRRVSRKSRTEVREVYRTTQTSASWEDDDEDDAAEERTVRKSSSHHAEHAESRKAAHYRKMRELRAERAALAEETAEEASDD